MKNEFDNDDEDISKHLAEEHGLTLTAAYVPISSEKKRSAGAKRVAKHRQQKREKGLVTVDLPIFAAHAIKRTGSFELWVKSLFPDSYVKDVNRALKLADKVAKLHPWVRRLLGLDI